jgi:ATP-dependent RNA helicase DeaD
MNNFLELNLPQDLLNAIEKMQFATPTPIQAQAIPVALVGRDILGSAQTGTGKTAAFAIPLVAHLMKNEQSMGIIMTPTRELATQVMQTIKKLIGPKSPIATALLIGGESIFRQFGQLQDDPRIIVGTPGRINDHLSRRSLELKNADFLVLDETDRMLDMGFGVQIDKILTHMPQQRQTLMFSATLPGNIIGMSKKYMKDAERIAVGSTSAPVTAIKQEVIRLAQPEKYATLTQQLNTRGGSVIIFVKTKHGADRLAGKLERENYEADAIHGDLRQNQRDKVIRRFREKNIRILVATDVAARGLDIPHIEHVINYDLPQCPEDYIHRIGRTARAGAEGEALCFVTPEENGKWSAIQRLINKGDSTEEEQQHGHRGGGNRYQRNDRPRGDRFKKDRFKGGGFKKSGGFKKDRFRDDRNNEKESQSSWARNEHLPVERKEGERSDHQKSEYRGEKRSYNSEKKFQPQHSQKKQHRKGQWRSFDAEGRPQRPPERNDEQRPEKRSDRPHNEQQSQGEGKRFYRQDHKPFEHKKGQGSFKRDHERGEKRFDRSNNQEQRNGEGKRFDRKDRKPYDHKKGQGSFKRDHEQGEKRFDRSNGPQQSQGDGKRFERQDRKPYDQKKGQGSFKRDDRKPFHSNKPKWQDRKDRPSDNGDQPMRRTKAA